MSSWAGTGGVIRGGRSTSGLTDSRDYDQFKGTVDYAVSFGLHRNLGNKFASGTVYKRAALRSSPCVLLCRSLSLPASSRLSSSAKPLLTPLPHVNRTVPLWRARRTRGGSRSFLNNKIEARTLDEKIGSEKGLSSVFESGLAAVVIRALIAGCSDGESGRERRGRGGGSLSAEVGRA
jgi:hypothetical protein